MGDRSRKGTTGSISIKFEVLFANLIAPPDPGRRSARSDGWGLQATWPSVFAELGCGFEEERLTANLVRSHGPPSLRTSNEYLAMGDIRIV